MYEIDNSLAWKLKTTYPAVKLYIYNEYVSLLLSTVLMVIFICNEEHAVMTLFRLIVQ